MNLANFALSLAYELERQAKRANQDANDAYYQAIAGGYRFDGGRLIQDEDAAWAECQRTGRLADAADDAVCEVEDLCAERERAA
jgi:hypothetical protein